MQACPLSECVETHQAQHLLHTQTIRSVLYSLLRSLVRGRGHGTHLIPARMQSQNTSKRTAPCKPLMPSGSLSRVVTACSISVRRCCWLAKPAAAIEPTEAMRSLTDRLDRWRWIWLHSCSEKRSTSLLACKRRIWRISSIDGQFQNSLKPLTHFRLLLTPTRARQHWLRQKQLKAKKKKRWPTDMWILQPATLQMLCDSQFKSDSQTGLVITASTIRQQTLAGQLWRAVKKAEARQRENLSSLSS